MVLKVKGNSQGGAKDAVNNAALGASLAKIKRDYDSLPKLIRKFESSKFTIFEAHGALSGNFYSRLCRL